MSKQVTAVVLAAGQSKRMGEAKLLLPWGGHTILDTTLQQIKASQATDFLLISGGYRQNIEKIAQAHGITTVYNPDFADGEMLSSLQTAIRYLKTTSSYPPDGILIMLGDLPFIDSAIIDDLIQAFQQSESKIVAPTYNGRRGHPVLLSSDLFEALLALPKDGAPRDLLRQHTADTTLVPVESDVILRDIDTPSEYHRWRREG